MKKLFENGWVTLGMMLLCSIGDLITLPTRFKFGFGFVICFIFFMALGAWTTNKR